MYLFVVFFFILSTIIAAPLTSDPDIHCRSCIDSDHVFCITKDNTFACLPRNLAPIAYRACQTIIDDTDICPLKRFVNQYPPTCTECLSAGLSWCLNPLGPAYCSGSSSCPFGGLRGEPIECSRVITPLSLRECEDCTQGGGEWCPAQQRCIKGFTSTPCPMPIANFKQCALDIRSCRGCTSEGHSWCPDGVCRSDCEDSIDAFKDCPAPKDFGNCSTCHAQSFSWCLLHDSPNQCVESSETCINLAASSTAIAPPDCEIPTNTCRSCITADLLWCMQPGTQGTCRADCLQGEYPVAHTSDCGRPLDCEQCGEVGGDWCFDGAHSECVANSTCDGEVVDCPDCEHIRCGPCAVQPGLGCNWCGREEEQEGLCVPAADACPSSLSTYRGSCPTITPPPEELREQDDCEDWGYQWCPREGCRIACEWQEPAVNCSAVTQYDALEALYRSAGGPHWFANQGWADDADECNWIGVNCTEDGHVRVLRLPSNNLTGTLPAELGCLPELQGLHLDGNADITSCIPESFGHLGHLQHLSLDFTSIQCTLPAGIAKLPYLQFLYIRYASLMGLLPGMELPEGHRLHLDHNQLWGPLPEGLRNSLKLQELWLGCNAGLEDQEGLLTELGNRGVIIHNEPCEVE